MWALSGHSKYILVYTPELLKSKVYDYMKGDYESIKRELELLDWESEMDGKV